MADDEGKATSVAEQNETVATPEEQPTQDAEPAPPTEQAAESEAPPPTEVEAIGVKEEDTPTEAPVESGGTEAEEGKTEEAPSNEKPAEEGEDAPATADAPAAPDEEAGGDAAPPQEEPKPEGEEQPEGETVPLTETEEVSAETQPPGEGTEEEGAPLPQSEDFATGEKPEVPLDVSADVLSREGTPVVPPDGLEEEEMVHPGTPEREGEKGVLFEDEEEEDEEEVVPKLSREELVERYHAALQEREMLNQKNHGLQHKLAEYFKRKKTEDSRQEVDRNVTDQEQRYVKYMTNLEELRHQETAERESYNEQIEEMKECKAAKQALVEEEWKQYCDFKRSVALSSVNSRSGRPLTLKEFEIYEVTEVKKEAEVSQVRLENIKLRNRLRKRELQLKQKEELAEGLHLIDFEQLKIENQTYNEKIEERNEELMKLRKKITSTVQVLTHLKEKLQFVQGENQVARQELGHIEADVAGKRDILSRTKQARDALRHDNSKLQQKCGLLGNRLLLRDYEEGTDEITDLSHRLDQLKRTHAELTLSISGVKKKIEQARAQAQS